jgi:hypothetical protein
MTNELEDRAALADLVAGYARAADRRLADESAALFVEDGSYSIVDGGAEPIRVEGRERMARGFARLSRYEATFHHVGQQTVALAGDRATGETYCIAHHVERADDGSRSVMVMHIRYQDTYVRTLEGWRFEERILMVDWRETRPLTE